MRSILIIAFSTTLSILCLNCKPKAQDLKPSTQNAFKDKLVLAQWSFNKELFAGQMNTFDFIREAKEMGFSGVEFVNQFFMDKIEDEAYLDSLRATSEKIGIKNTLLMIDRAGNLGASDEKEREAAVLEHKKWMLAAAHLGCPNIRVNAHGDGSSEEVFEACKSSIAKLLTWGKQRKVGVIIENHGGYSSDGDWLYRLIQELEPYGVASLADFDNWCIERENGELWGAPCVKEYDRYKGMQQLLPSAKSVSVKAFEFDANGLPVKSDFSRMFRLIRDSGYDGYLAVEFEGHGIDAKEGILKTKALAERFINHKLE